MLSDYVGPPVCSSTIHIILYAVMYTTIPRLGCKLVSSWQVSRDLASHCLGHLAICLFLSWSMLPAHHLGLWVPETEGKENTSFGPRWLSTLLLKECIARNLNMWLRWVGRKKESPQNFKQMAFISGQLTQINSFFNHNIYFAKQNRYKRRKAILTTLGLEIVVDCIRNLKMA